MFLRRALQSNSRAVLAQLSKPQSASLYQSTFSIKHSLASLSSSSSSVSSSTPSQLFRSFSSKSDSSTLKDGKVTVESKEINEAEEAEPEYTITKDEDGVEYKESQIDIDGVKVDMKERVEQEGEFDDHEEAEEDDRYCRFDTQEELDAMLAPLLEHFEMSTTDSFRDLNEKCEVSLRAAVHLVLMCMPCSVPAGAAMRVYLGVYI